MARIRSVHPGLFTDEAWVSCSPLARVLFIGLWTDADDQGLFEWKPLQIKMRLLPGDVADVGAMLDELAAADLIKSFEHGGKRFGAIRNFRKHQRPKKPNSTHFLPPEFRTYVAIDAPGSEPADDEPAPVPNQFPTGGEISPQMEDGGWRREEPPTPLAGGQHDLATDQPPAEPSSRRKPKRSIPDGFPSADLIAEQQAAARAAGADVDLAYQAERFRNWAQGGDHRYADWPKTWANWCLRTIKEAPKRAPVITEVAIDSDDQWRRRVRNHVAKRAYWNADDLGPAPGKPGCRVPAEVLREFGLEPTPPLLRVIG